MTLRPDQKQNAQLNAGSATNEMDRPRTGANQNRAGSPITQVRVREVYSMTDEVQGGMEWVPRFGMLEVPAERAALIRGLFELAAFVADHPEFPVPAVRARFFAASLAETPEGFAAELALVDQLAAALPADAITDADGRVKVEGRMGSVEVLSVAYSPESWAQYKARNSYAANVITEPVVGESR